MRSLRKDILDRLLNILEDDSESALFVKWSEANFVDESVKFLLAVMREKKRMISEAWYEAKGCTHCPSAIFDRFCAEGAPLSLNPRDHRDLENRKQLMDRCLLPNFTMWDGIYYNIFRLVVDNDGLKCFKDWQSMYSTRSLSLSERKDNDVQSLGCALDLLWCSLLPSLLTVHSPTQTDNLFANFLFAEDNVKKGGSDKGGGFLKVYSVSSVATHPSS